ncbi:RHS repeat protein [Bradyrhizobium diazoefficiens]|nr:RHS repeat-associated core domain-containing protein [Bradyrhizobium diazoefficiens]MBR0968506.1 RHS repeat protein [Bradyrhizobium diazoefficiens]MBR0981830.1 RHS repeat protein [Bradyrhizobium diazoefficiens]MBR1011281.1 RHS repeat protein [Bradyrhizobium diazoefficiens]MBR1015748.1 RHS repeat protein [Bradyrhizobium diazoefficiens]MBR1055121.1 RHS repeat protein [Bradyrhizobium diazoefficiens]
MPRTAPLFGATRSITVALSLVSACLFGGPAFASKVTATIAGTVLGGSDQGTTGIGVFGPAGSLNGRSFTLVFTFDDTLGQQDVAYNGTAPYYSSIEGSNGGSPGRAVLTIGGRSVQYPTPGDTGPESKAYRTLNQQVYFQVGSWLGGRQNNVQASFGPENGGVLTTDYDWRGPLSYAYSGGDTNLSFFYNVCQGAQCVQANGTLKAKSITIVGPDRSQKNLGNCRCDGAPEGNPINSANGNKYQLETDFVGGSATGLSFIRSYNSADNSGSKWHSNWHRGLLISSDGTTVTAVRADGRQEIFSLEADKYVPDPDVVSVLAKHSNGWTLTTADDSVESYAPKGQLLSITTRTGLTTNLTYDTGGRLVVVTGPFGHKLSFTYDSGNRVSSMMVPDGGNYTYHYDTHGNLTGVTRPDSSLRQYLYENASLPNALTAIIDENGTRFASWTYDSVGRAITSQHAGGVEAVTLSYANNGTTGVRDAIGNYHTYSFLSQFGSNRIGNVSGTPIRTLGGQAFTYDNNGFRSSKTDYNGNVTTYVHDARGNETSRTEASGTALARTVTTTWHPTFHLPTEILEPGRKTDFAYDGRGNLLTKTVSAQNGTRTWSFTYNNSGQVLTATEPRGFKTSYAYDQAGDLIKVTNALGQSTSYGYDPDGRVHTVTDPNGLTTTLTYNSRGLVTSRSVAQRLTSYGYDAVGQLTSVKRPDGSMLHLSYDAAHRLIAVADSIGNHISYSLDLASNRVGEKVYAANGTLIGSRSYTYDSVNRIHQAIGAKGQTTSFAYDSNSNLVQTSDPLGNATAQAYDALNRLVAVTDPASGPIQSSYDLMNHLISVTDPRGLRTSYTYDGLDDVIALSSPDTGHTSKTYDLAGNVVTSTDARGVTTTYSYDALNRIIKKAYADGTATTYTYDGGAHAIGRLSSMSDASGGTIWSYNIFGDVVQKQQKVGSTALTTQFAYDDQTGQLTGILYPSGIAVFYGFDANGRVSVISNQPPSAKSATVLLSNIVYQPFGPPASWTYGNNSTYRRTYDLDGRVAGIALPANTSMAYTYDAAGRITGLAETGLPAKAFSYDALGRITSYSSGSLKQTYSYDSVGNRTAFTAVQSPATNVNLTYHYDAVSNRLLGIAGTSKETFTYDAAGNMLSQTGPGGDFTYTYNARGRRTRTYVGAIPTIDAVNGIDQRTSLVNTNASSNLFVYDEAGHLIGTYDGKGVAIEETVWLADLAVAVLNPAGHFFIAPDHLGAPHQITNQAGQVVWLWDHDPFGNGHPSGTFTYDLRFPGQRYDAAAGTHYNYFRDYDPRTGRYIESDPIGLRGGINTYGYVGQNPLWASDPFGEDAIALPLTRFATSDLVALGSGRLFGALGLLLSLSGDTPQDCPNQCPPCRTISGKIVPLETIAYRPLDVPPLGSSQHGIEGPHHNLYKANQNPKNCRCFWQPIGAVSPSNLPPGAIPIEPFAN